MMELTLTRFAPTMDGVFGRLGTWTTVEEEWRGNRPRVSCIPAGSYKCVRSTFHRGGYPCFEVTGVPGRALIKFHRANTEEDLLGCIGLGMRLGVLRVRDEDSGEMVYKLAAMSSRVAFGAWMAMMEGVGEFTLHVVGWEGETYDAA